MVFACSYAKAQQNSCFSLVPMQKHNKTTGFLLFRCNNTTKLMLLAGSDAKTQQNYCFSLVPMQKHSKTNAFRLCRCNNTAKLMVFAGSDAKTQQNAWFLLVPMPKHSKTTAVRLFRCKNPGAPSAPHFDSFTLIAKNTLFGVHALASSLFSCFCFCFGALCARLAAARRRWPSAARLVLFVAFVSLCVVFV